MIDELRNKISNLASNTDFIHHKWFVKWHLSIVEKISLELCDIYTKADKDLVLTLVWIHDYAKIINFSKQHDLETILTIKPILTELNFETVFIDKAIKYLLILESKMSVDLSLEPIEVQIASSADAASHMVGPFFGLYWYENPEMEIDDILKSNIAKATKDWERKITLPEIKNKFKPNYDFIKLFAGELPDKFIG